MKEIGICCLQRFGHFATTERQLMPMSLIVHTEHWNQDVKRDQYHLSIHIYTPIDRLHLIYDITFYLCLEILFDNLQSE